MTEHQSKPDPLHYPVCGEWDCDDEFDWDWVSRGEREYRGVKRERQIVWYHEPRLEWRSRLQQERDAKNGGEPLWVSRPPARTTEDHDGEYALYRHIEPGEQ